MAKKVAVKREIVSVPKKYELMLILSPDLRETEVEKKLKEIEGMMEKAGGKILEEDLWGKKKFSYRIQKHTEGIYMVYNLELPSDFIKELKDHLRIEKNVMRSMLISIPEDYVYTRYDIEGMGDKEVFKKTKKKSKPAFKKEEKPVVEPVEDPIEDPIADPVEEPVEDPIVDPVVDPVEDPVVDPIDKPTDQPDTESEKKDKEYETELDRKLDALLEGDDLKL